MPRIAFIGGGSLTWIPRFAHDLLREPRLAGSTMVLMDTDPAALELMGRYSRALIAKRGGQMGVETTTDRDEALQGADFVCSTFMAGGHLAWAKDLNIAYSYGIRHPKGMSVGPGGLIQGLKAVPQLLDLAHAMECICPQATLFNFTNPMSSISLALQRHSHVKTVGVCHGLLIGLDVFARLMGCRRDDLIARGAGVNHLDWVVSVRDKHTGQELLPEIAERMRRLPRLSSPDEISDERVLQSSYEQYRLFGALPVPGDLHVTEFWPYFLRPGIDLWETLQLRHNFVERRIEGKERYREAILAGLSGAAPLPEPRGESLEELENMIASMIYNEQRIYQLNVINNGAIENVMPGVCVESPVMIDQYGFHPVHFGSLPPAIAGWINLLGTVQDLTVRAAVEGSRQYALQALLLDPMCYHMEISNVERMLDDLLAANREWLPAFFR